MNFSKFVIGLLTAVTLSVVAFVFVIDPLLLRPPETAEPALMTNERLNPPGEGAPRLAIITPTTLDVVRVKSSTGKDQDTLVDTVPAESDDDEGAAANSEDVAAQLLIASIDYLSGSIANELSRTGRLEVVEPLRVSQVIDDLARSSSDQNADSQKGSEQKKDQEPDRVNFWRALVGSLERQPGTTKDSEFSGTRGEAYSSQSATMSTSSQSQSLYRADLAEAALTLGAKYILVVYVSEPRYESFRQDIPDTDRHVHVIRADPVISYRLFEGATGTVVLSEVTSPADPIEIVYEDGNLPVASTYAKAKMSLEKSIAQNIVTNIVDTIYPPQISSSDATLITIDRGSRDGMLVGDIFEISRDAGEAVGAGNIRLSEPIREPVGSVRVVRVQNTISYVEPLTGGPFVRGDYVDVAGSDFASRKKSGLNGTGSQQGNTPNPKSAPALGARMIAAQTEGAENKPRVAVRELTVQYIDCGDCGVADPGGSLLSQSMLAELQNEQRILVVSRQDMDALLDERRFSDSASGRSMRAGLAGMTSAHYVVSGALSIAPRTTVSTRRVAGREVEAGRTSTLGVSGQVRILDAETTEQVEATTIEFTLTGGVSQANLRKVSDRAARMAVSDLMNKLFPLAVLEKVSDSEIEISGGRQAGLSIGSRLQAFAVGPAVSDLYSGQASASRTRSGVLVVTDVRRDRATAKFSDRAFDIKRGDQLELLPESGRSSAIVKEAQAVVSPVATDAKAKSEPPDNPDEF